MILKIELCCKCIWNCICNFKCISFASQLNQYITYNQSRGKSKINSKSNNGLEYAPMDDHIGWWAIFLPRIAFPVQHWLVCYEKPPIDDIPQASQDRVGHRLVRTGWLRVGYGMVSVAWGWLQVTGLLRGGYRVITGWLRGGYGMVMGWLRVGHGVVMWWLRGGYRVITEMFQGG